MPDPRKRSACRLTPDSAAFESGCVQPKRLTVQEAVQSKSLASPFFAHPLVFQPAITRTARTPRTSALFTRTLSLSLSDSPDSKKEKKKRPDCARTGLFLAGPRRAHSYGTQASEEQMMITADSNTLMRQASMTERAP